MRCVALLPLALLALSACGDAGAAGGGSAAVVVDSAGVQIVTSSDPVWAAGEEWRVGEAPTLEIGLAEGPNEYLFALVRNALRRVDGSIVVANAQTLEVRLFDPSGRHLASMGGRGDGPGEFGFLTWVGLLGGDSIAAYDAMARRISIFSPQGEFVRDASLRLPQAGSFPMPVGLLRDGSMALQVLEPGGNRPAEGTVTRTPERLLRFDLEGAFIDTLGLLPGSEFLMQSVSGANGTNLIMLSPPLFGRSSVTGIAGGRVVVGSNDDYDLRVLAPGGLIERSIRRAIQPEPVTDEMLEAASRERTKGVASEEERARRERSLREAPHGSTVPFYERILGDDEGNLWVEEFTVPGEPPAGWTVFGTEGRLLGTVDLPEEFRPLHIGSDFVLGVATDDLGVERVRMYGLEKGAGR